MLTDNTLANTYLWFTVAKPEPTAKDFQTQVGVHFEEVAEMIVEVSSADRDTQNLLNQAHAAMHTLAEHLKKSPVVIEIHPNNEVNFLDALCDQVVTATGVANYHSFNFIGAMTEVNGSNYSKFDDSGKAILDPNGKIMKGQDYYKANLIPFLQKA